MTAKIITQSSGCSPIARQCGIQHSHQVLEAKSTGGDRSIAAMVLTTGIVAALIVGSLLVGCAGYIKTPGLEAGWGPAEARVPDGSTGEKPIAK